MAHINNIPDECPGLQVLTQHSFAAVRLLSHEVPGSSWYLQTYRANKKRLMCSCQPCPHRRQAANYIEATVKQSEDNVSSDKLIAI